MLNRPRRLRTIARDALTYQAVRSAFEVDGSWRDLYAFETSVEEWRALLEGVLRGPWQVRMSYNDVETSSISEILRTFEVEEMAAQMAVDLGGAVLKCHFFGPAEIEFDLDPSEINKRTFQTLCDFMQLMARLAQRNIYLTEESAPQYAHFAYLADAGTFAVLKRPASPTPFGAALAREVSRVLAPFRHPDRWSGPEAVAAARDWRKSVYHPNQIEWHTQLTADEFCALHEFDAVVTSYIETPSPDEAGRVDGVRLNLPHCFWGSAAKLKEVLKITSTK